MSTKSGEDVRTIPTALIDSNKTVNVKFKSFKFMKIYRITHGSKQPWTQILRIMKLTVILLFVSLMAMSASTYSQNTKLNLSAKNSSLIDIFRQIEDQSEFYFYFKKEDVKSKEAVSVELKDALVTEILDQVLDKTGLEYKIIDRYVVVKQKGSADPEMAIQQERKISGKVSDPSGQPIPGASVVVKGTTIGVTSDNDGNFSLSLPAMAKALIFSFVGMKTQEVELGNKSDYRITLSEETVGLDEVVAVGYGTQSRFKVTGAIASTTAKDLSGRQVRSLAQMLQGKMSGVSISTNSGKPGDEGTNIVIRGMNSFATSSAPLVLIDGVYGEMNSVVADNIESVSVMKDASSAAIYGSRAANGVILITTKRGQAGKLNITYNANFSTQYYTSMPKTITDPVEYMEMWNRASTFSNDQFKYKQEYIDGMKSGKYQGYDYTDNIFQHAFVQSHNININGGTEKIKFNMGINYLDQPGIVKMYNYDRVNVLTNIDAKINDWISAGGQINLTRGVSAAPSLGDFEIMIGYYNQKPTMPPQFPDGRWVSTQFPDEYFTWGAAEKLTRGQSINQQYFGDVQAYLKITPIKGLLWETKVATKYNHSFNKNFNTGNHAVYVYSTGEPTEPQNPNSRSVNISSPTSLYNTMYSTLNYDKTIDKHHINALAGYSVESFNIDYLNASRSKYSTNNLGEIDAGDPSTKANGGSSEAYALQSYFGRLDYDYDGKYLLQANLRADQSSRFPKGKRLGIFPSFSAGWRISQEDFMKDIKWLSDVKLRASWGQLGNQNIGTYPYQETYSLGQNYPFDGLSVGARQDGLKNQNLTWETTTVTDVGADLNIKNGLFSMSVDYYYKLTDGILRGQQVTALVGLDAPTINNGSVSNKGIELVLGHTKQVNDKFKYWVNSNLTFTKNNLVNFGAKEIGGTTIKEEGKEWDAWYMYQFDGVYQSDAECQALPIDGNIMKPGLAKLKDINGDHKITNLDRTYVGNRYPKFTYGLNLGAQLGDFDFSAFIQGVQGLSSYQNNWGIAPFTQGNRPSTFWRNAWTPENPSNEIPSLYISSKGNVLDNYPNTFYLFNASYLRLKNLQIGYNIPSEIIKRLRLSSARISVSGENLFTITNYPGQDPERNLGDITYASYPQIKSYSFGLTVKF